MVGYEKCFSGIKLVYNDYFMLHIFYYVLSQSELEDCNYLQDVQAPLLIWKSIGLISILLILTVTKYIDSFVVTKN